MKVDPIIAVINVEKSSKWYRSVFDWRSRHGGKEFDVLVSRDDEITLCLHKWGEHNHPTMLDSNILPGNGIILYFRVSNIDELRQNLRKMDYATESEISLSPNSAKREFSLRDLDGYYITVAEYHEYDTF